MSTLVTSTGIYMRRRYSLTQDIPLGPGSCEVDVAGCATDAWAGLSSTSFPGVLILPPRASEGGKMRDPGNEVGLSSVGWPRADPLEAAGGEETKFVSARVGQSWSVLPWRCPVQFSVGIVSEDWKEERHKNYSYSSRVRMHLCNNCQDQLSMRNMYWAGYLDGLQTSQCLGLDGVTQYFQILDCSISIHVCHKIL